MPDFQELYFKLFVASEQAVAILANALRECDELYTGADPSAGASALLLRAQEEGEAGRG